MADIIYTVRNSQRRSECGSIVLKGGIGHKSVRLVDDTGKPKKKVGEHFCRRPTAPKAGEILRLDKRKLNPKGANFDYVASYYPKGRGRVSGFYHRLGLGKVIASGDWEPLIPATARPSDAEKRSKE